MRSSRPPRGGSPGHAVGGRPLAPAALPALLRATHLSGLALGSAFGRLRESGVTAAKLFEVVCKDGGADPQGALAGAPVAGSGLEGPASRAGPASQSRLDEGAVVA